MKSLIFFASLLVSSNVFAANPCFQFSEGPKEVTIGWFNKKTVTADTVCVPDQYPNENLVETVNFVLKNGTDVVAEYPATAVRYSNTNVRFTLENGEPEPQQFEAVVTSKSKSLIEFDFSGYVIETSSGGKFECTEVTDKVGAIRKLTLTQIEDSTQWLLEITSQAVVPNAVLTTELASILTVSLMEDVMFFLRNTEENIAYKIYMDELYATYLYVGGSQNSITFDCEQE